VTTATYPSGAHGRDPGGGADSDVGGAQDIGQVGPDSRWVWADVPVRNYTDRVTGGRWDQTGTDSSVVRPATLAAPRLPDP